MGTTGRIMLVTFLVVVAMASSARGEVDNVAFQWTNLLNTMVCDQFPTIPAPFTVSIQAQLHLAQWHALLALRSTGACTPEAAVVAYASFKIMSHYFAITQPLDFYIGPLLESQLQQMNITAAEERLAQRLGEAVADRMIQTRSPAGQFTLREVKRALDAAPQPPPPGVFRYFNDSPEARATANFFFAVLPTLQPFILPHPQTFLPTLGLKPPKIPSREWDANWASLKDVGRVDWRGRTAEMNVTANLVACARVGNNKCSYEMRATAAAQSALPASTSLYDSVLLLAKISVAIFDAAVAQVHFKYALWFWRPVHAFRAGDPSHAPIPDWTPFHPTPQEPEYPSGTVALVTAGAYPLQKFFGRDAKVAFSIEGGGTFNCPGFVGDAVPTRNYSSLEAFVEESQRSRMYSGAHFQQSVEDGRVLGEIVGEYVEKHWAETTPSGVLPDQAFLDLVFTVPKKLRDFTPVRYNIPRSSSDN